VSPAPSVRPIAEQTRLRVARALLEAGAVSLTPEAPVTFKSGLRSPVYVDSRRLIFEPDHWHTVIAAFAASLLDEEVLAGVEAAGIPHSSALAFHTGRRSVFVRKATKDHGLGRRIEGGDVAGLRTVLIEDMVTTGSSSLSAIEALREAGAQVVACLAIVTYGFIEAEQAFEAARIELATLTTFAALLEVARASGRIDDAGAATIGAWLADPHAWGAA
jgi:orotate phosphoribosyltransferase